MTQASSPAGPHVLAWDLFAEETRDLPDGVCEARIIAALNHGIGGLWYAVGKVARVRNASDDSRVWYTVVALRDGGTFAYARLSRFEPS